MKRKFTEHVVTTMHAELATVSEPVYKHTQAEELVASHKLERMPHVRMLVNLAAWTNEKGSIGLS